ncbi:MAG: hypothetical protein KZQ77_18100, partial [Candidatus Thiodiazotropha sp. (ex Notomyrtea botanica)]|nr:hypothetical protein [Candidatus Thiodiazotropha sp. (ex Notomyrtea botanica)]
MNNSYRKITAALSGLCIPVLLLVGCGTGSDEPDPVVVDKPIAYVKRPVIDTATTDIRVTQAFEAGGDLYLRDRASPSAAEYNITGSITGGQGDVRDVS